MDYCTHANLFVWSYYLNFRYAASVDRRAFLVFISLSLCFHYPIVWVAEDKRGHTCFHREREREREREIEGRGREREGERERDREREIER